VQLLAKFAEDDRIEQMNAQKRRMKQLEHQRAVELMLEERRRQSAAQQVRFTSAAAFLQFLAFVLNPVLSFLVDFHCCCELLHLHCESKKLSLLHLIITLANTVRF